MNGIIPLYKPKGMTSHDCVMKIRRILQMKKVGHTGTLDPSVEGVLPICIGEATKIIPYLLTLHKTYIAEITLGTSTTTEDAEGEVVESKAVEKAICNDKIAQVLEQFKGDIVQIPPMYSAIKVNGKKLYEYARENKAVERPKRNVTIMDIFQLDKKVKTDQTFSIQVTCSKGTYIRTLAVDIGKKLGYPAHMSYLQRIETDGIHLSETKTFEDIEQAVHTENLHSVLLPVEKGISHLYHYNVSSNLKTRILQGQKLLLPEGLPTNQPYAMMYQGKLLAIYEQHPNEKEKMKPARVFNLYK